MRSRQLIGDKSPLKKVRSSLVLRCVRTGVSLVILFYTGLIFFIPIDKEGGEQENEGSISSNSKTKPLPGIHKAATPQSKNATTVAYAISLIKCGDKQSNDAGLVDAALVMRHSIHKISVRNPESGSKYDYKMYAIVHSQAEHCSGVLKDAGFELVIIDKSPISPAEIKGEYLRNNIESEWCCGSDEFIKLYAYTLPEPIIVHTDIDFLFLQPMDDLFDAILFPKESPQGRVSRSRIALESPGEGFPDRIDAFITRDWPQVIPGRKALYQAGFLVARRRPETLTEAVEVIREGNYKEGYDLRNGWGEGGYGGFVGAMAMQGLMAYYYDVVQPGAAVELNQCRFNHMGMDVRYRHPPNFISRKVKKIGKCRNNLAVCEDCMVTNISLIYNVHYTQCRKPWNCIGLGHGGGRIPGARPASAIDTNAGDYDHCMALVKRWHEVRLDLENSIFAFTRDKTILRGILGQYRKDIFRGHCSGEGGTNYTNIQGVTKTFQVMNDMYA